MTQRQKYISWIIGIIVAIVTALCTLTDTIKSFFQSDDKTVNTNVIIKGKENTTINGNGNAVQENNIVVNYNNNNNVSIKRNNKIQYSIIGTSNEKLLDGLRALKKIEIVPKSNNVIEITYTGEIFLLHENLDTFFYNGGHILLKVNNLNCYEFENIKIPAMKPNSQDAIINEIQKNIEIQISKNSKIFLNKINECISKY